MKAELEAVEGTASEEIWMLMAEAMVEHWAGRTIPVEVIRRNMRNRRRREKRKRLKEEQALAAQNAQAAAASEAGSLPGPADPAARAGGAESATKSKRSTRARPRSAEGADPGAGPKPATGVRAARARAAALRSAGTAARREQLGLR
jgi:hypothetical protein